MRELSIVNRVRTQIARLPSNPCAAMALADMSLPLPRALCKVLPYCLLGVATTAAAQDTNHVVIGPGAAIVPTYEGSEDTRILPLPLLDIKQGRLFANFADGAGILVVDDGPVEVGASIALVGGYRRRDVPEGIDPVDFAPGARLFSRFRFGMATVTIGGTRALGGTDGTTADASLTYTIPVAPKFVLIPTVTAIWANRRHMDRYFGIDPEEAAATGLPTFRADGGIKNLAGGVTGMLSLSSRITLVATAGTSRLTGDAANSPLNQRKWTPTGYLGVGYRF